MRLKYLLAIFFRIIIIVILFELRRLVRMIKIFLRVIEIII